MSKLFCNVLIFGAGIIGASLALKLAQSGIKVIIVNDKYPTIPNNEIIPNIRVSAINHASVEFFKTINVWKNIPNQFCTPYYCMKTWEWPTSTVTFHAKSIGLEKMGYTIENNRLQLALWKNILDFEIIKLYCPYTLVSLEYHNIFWKCILDENIIIYSQLLVGADGANSQVRKKLGIDISGWRYHQCCMLFTVKTEKNTSGTIWQVFNPHGPIGFLPLYDNWGSLMWFDTPDCINQMKYLSKSILEQKIEKKFHEKLGRVILHNMIAIPLIYQQANRYISLGGALVGDSAHILHPLAGQGINLGIRDVISLSKLLVNINISEIKQGISEDMLIFYQNDRYRDIFIMQSSINCLYFIFSNNLFPLKIARNIAFMTVEKFPYLKKKILQYAALGI